jgi:hypothetical protein
MIDSDIVVIVGPQPLIENIADDPRLSGTILDEASQETGGLLAERQLSPLKAPALAGALFTAADKGLTVAEHFKRYMQQSGSNVCEVVVRPWTGDQQLLRFHKNMTSQEIMELIEEVIQPNTGT